MAKKKKSGKRTPRQAAKRRPDVEREFKKDPEPGYWNNLDQRIYAIFEEAYRRDWTWSDLARFSGVSYWTVWSLGELRTRFPQDHTLFRLMKPLGLTYEIVRKPSSVQKRRRQQKKLARA